MKYVDDEIYRKVTHTFFFVREHQANGHLLLCSTIGLSQGYNHKCPYIASTVHQYIQTKLISV